MATSLAPPSPQSPKWYSDEDVWPHSEDEMELDYDSFYNAPVECSFNDSDGTFTIEIARIPVILLHTIVAWLREGRGLMSGGFVRKSLARAWMMAVAQHFPDTPLTKLRSADPQVLPGWLEEDFHHYQDALVLGPGGVFARRPVPDEGPKTGPNPLSILAATSQCRFRGGFASEGMLCNNPPIPLRVLDFLEHTEDLLNLALVCKATHQAAHVLLQREFPRGTHTEYQLCRGIRRRKRGMLASALRRPIPNTAASTPMLAPTTGTEACTGADDREHYPCLEFSFHQDNFHQVYPCIHQCLAAMLLARELPGLDPQEPLLVTSITMDLPLELNWRHELEHEHAIVLDEDAVVGAIAELKKLGVGGPDEIERWKALREEAWERLTRNADEWALHGYLMAHDWWGEDGLWTLRIPKQILDVLVAAARGGQGVIVF